MKFITLITMATAAVAAVGDKYKLSYKKGGAELYPVNYDGEKLTVPTEGTAITITEGENSIFSVDGKTISYLDLLGWLWTGHPGEPSLGASSFDIAADGTFTLRDGPKEYYYCSPNAGVPTLNVKNSDTHTSCAFSSTRAITLHVQKI